jgi:hypothetical protein
MVQTNYSLPQIKEVDIGGKKVRMVDADGLRNIISQQWSAIFALGGRGASNPIIQKPLNMGANRIFGVSNSDTPADDEVLTYGKAQALYAPAVMAKELSIKGSAPIKLENLRGRASQPQPAWIPTVPKQFGKLPPFGSEYDGLVVSDGHYIFQADGVTLQWGALSALGATVTGTRSGMGTPLAPNTIYVQTDTGWVYLADSTGTSYSFLVGIAFGTDATRLGLTISAADDGAIFITTDTNMFWYVAGGVWVAMPFGGGADYVLMSDGHNPPSPIDDGAGNFVYVGYTP